jgi:transcription-repair coupling factor (superfamily II helicase)
MNTLSFPLLIKKIARSAAVQEALKALEKGKFPLKIEHAEGAFPGILISLIYAAAGGRILAVVPTDAEAALLEQDLRSANTSVSIFPWWGGMPYRDMAPLSAVFGERMRVLANLATGSGGIVIASEQIGRAHV